MGRGSKKELPSRLGRSPSQEGSCIDPIFREEGSFKSGVCFCDGVLGAHKQVLLASWAGILAERLLAPTSFFNKVVLLKTDVCFTGARLGAENFRLRPDWAETFPKGLPAPTPFFCRRPSLNPMFGFGCSGSGLRNGASQPIGPKSFSRGLLH